MISSILKLISFEKKNIFFFFTVLTIIVSFTEGFGIFLIYKLVGKELNFNVDILKTNSLDEYILPIILIFFFFKLILLNIYSFIRNHLVTKFIEKNGETLFKIYLNQNLIFYTLNNSSEFIRNIYAEVRRLASCYDSFLKFFGETLVFIFLVGILFYFNFQLTFFLIVTIFIISFIFIKISKNKLKFYGTVNLQNTKLVLNNLQEAFRSAREMKIFSLNHFYLNKFRNSNFIIQKTNSYSGSLQELPKNSFEFLLVLLVFVFLKFEGFFLIRKDNIFDAAFIVVAIFSGLRLIPGALRIVGFLNSLSNNLPSINEIYSLISKNKNKLTNVEKSSVTNFKKAITFKNVSFIYPGQKNYIFKNLNIKIFKNKKYLLKGESGSGKTSFADILSGLLKPVRGQVFIDKNKIETQGNSWFNKISYMSQNSQLFDSTILENITLKDYPSNINKQRLDYALRISNSDKFIYSFPSKLNYNVGENGQRLSGGQRQRILLARCLYKDADIIILDEFVSAVDEKNSGIILNLIRKIKNKTIILILHKYKKINFVDYVINFENSKVSLKKN
jgi:ABC-type multidrug transport system fused ATPase/permease subunit